MDLTENKPQPRTEPRKGLVYSAYTRCKCGAGIAIDGPVLDAYEASPRTVKAGAWICAAVARGDAEQGPEHDAPRAVHKYGVKYEGGPGVLPGANTRPTK